MRLLFLGSSLLLTTGAPAAAVTAGGKFTPPPAHCPATSRYHATKKGQKPLAHKLNQLPPGDLYKTVYRRVGGCEVPVIAGYGIGAQQPRE